MDNTHYTRIASAIEYIQANFKQQPRLDEVAEKVHLSPFHFQRLFTEWAGVSPKKFLQYISVEYAKRVLKKDRQASLFDVAYETGLSGTGRLHDLFVNIEGMTPGEFKNGGENLHIHYGIYESPFGNILIAATSKGVCYMSFVNDEKETLKNLHENFPGADIELIESPFHRAALQAFNTNGTEPAGTIKLHLKGTAFQIKVWEALLKIPMGQLSTYGDIAMEIQNPKASRAVGTAIGSNPVAFLIPCHRVIRNSGALGGYMWGTTRKTAMIGWEAARKTEV